MDKVVEEEESEGGTHVGSGLPLLTEVPGEAWRTLRERRDSSATCGQASPRVQSRTALNMFSR